MRLLNVIVVVWAAFASVSCGEECQVLTPAFETEGVAFRDDGGDSFEFATYDFGPEGYSDIDKYTTIDPTSANIHTMCFGDPEKRDGWVSLHMDLNQDIGSTQTTELDFEFGGCSNRLSTLSGLTEARTAIDGAHTLEGRRLNYNSMSVTIVSKNPPVVDLTLGASDEEGRPWTLTARGRVLRLGNSPVCDTFSPRTYERDLE